MGSLIGRSSRFPPSSASLFSMRYLNLNCELDGLESKALTHLPTESISVAFGRCFPGFAGSVVLMPSSQQSFIRVGTRTLLPMAFVVLAVLRLVRARSSSASVGGSP